MNEFFVQQNPSIGLFSLETGSTTTSQILLPTHTFNLKRNIKGEKAKLFLRLTDENLALLSDDLGGREPHWFM